MDLLKIKSSLLPNGPASPAGSFICPFRIDLGDHASITSTWPEALASNVEMLVSTFPHYRFPAFPQAPPFGAR